MTIKYLRRLEIVMGVTLALAACATQEIPQFNNEHSLSNSDKVLAFVGRKIQIVEFDPSEDDPKDLDDDVMLLHIDAAFKARYEILEIVHGEFSEELIDFKAYDHYGLPAFAQHDIALIYLYENEGQLYHWKYQWDQVYPTADGRHAACGDPYLMLRDIDQQKVERQPLVEIEFKPPVILKISDYTIPEAGIADYSERYVRIKKKFAEEYFTSPAFEINGDDALCKMGAYPDELFRLKAETVIFWQLRQEACEKKLGIEEFYRLDSPEYAQVMACVSDLSARGVLE